MPSELRTTIWLHGAPAARNAGRPGFPMAELMLLGMHMAIGAWHGLSTAARSARPSKRPGHSVDSCHRCNCLLQHLWCSQCKCPRAIATTHARRPLERHRAPVLVAAAPATAAHAPARLERRERRARLAAKQQLPAAEARPGVRHPIDEEGRRSAGHARRAERLDPPAGGRGARGSVRCNFSMRAALQQRQGPANPGRVPGS